MAPGGAGVGFGEGCGVGEFVGAFVGGAVGGLVGGEATVAGATQLPLKLIVYADITSDIDFVIPGGNETIGIIVKQNKTKKGRKKFGSIEKTTKNNNSPIVDLTFR